MISELHMFTAGLLLDRLFSHNKKGSAVLSLLSFDRKIKD